MVKTKERKTKIELSLLLTFVPFSFSLYVDSSEDLLFTNSLLSSYFFFSAFSFDTYLCLYLVYLTTNLLDVKALSTILKPFSLWM